MAKVTVYTRFVKHGHIKNYQPHENQILERAQGAIIGAEVALAA